MKPGPTRHIVAENLRRELEGQTLSMNEFASFAGVSRSQVYDVLAGRKAPSVDWLQKVAGALKVEPWTLLKKGAASKGGKAKAKKKKK
jgi:transcriptional regulator with XRE-family HTH domain